MRARIPFTYEEFNPEWENLEVWDQDGTVQNKKYSRIGQLGGTRDKKEQGEGESGSYRSDLHLLQEEKPPLFRNQESLRIIQDSQNIELVRAKPSDRSKGEWNCTQWSKVWRISMLILTCLLLFVPGTVWFEGVEGVLVEEMNVSRFGGGCLAQEYICIISNYKYLATFSLGSCNEICAVSGKF